MLKPSQPLPEMRTPDAQGCKPSVLGQKWPSHVLVVPRDLLFDPILRMRMLAKIDFFGRVKEIAIPTQCLYLRAGDIVNPANSGWISQDQGLELMTLQVGNKTRIRNMSRQ